MNCPKQLSCFCSGEHANQAARAACWRFGLFALGCLLSTGLLAQPYGESDRGQPGDQMIQEYLRQETERIEADFLGNIRLAEDWNQARPRFRQEYFEMLGLAEPSGPALLDRRA